MWKCGICKKYFIVKERMLRHFLIVHDSKHCWYNKKHAIITNMDYNLNPSRRDSYQLEYEERESPGNALEGSENVGIIYDMS